MSERTVRIGIRGRDRSDPDHECVELVGLNKDESDRLDSMTRGQCWVRVGKDGRLESREAHKKPPEPTDDEEMIGFWGHDSRRRKVQLQLLNPERPLFSPHITIQSLCGYYYTPENYKKEAAKLESYGFERLRSRRGDDGRFWEAWYLPGLWAAKGALKEAIVVVKETPGDERKRLDAAVAFLCHNMSFGSLDVSVQRAAMVMDE